MPPIITVDRLAKAYRIGLKDQIPDTLVGAVTGLAKAPVRKFRQLRRLNTFGQTAAGGEAETPADIVWALRDVSFEVEEGEVLGVIGRNGAGKSTLLKILSRITEPTSGRAVLRGRVSSLLEVGTGFHPELTGRDNVYLNGTILGMTKREIDAKFDEIVDFSGVERFLDTPIKRYSSGMQVRLAFAVAAHLEPEILIVDEVLAVGDAEFQKKCMGKMQDVARGGRTVLFVSHNMQAVSTLTTHAILIAGGRIVCSGPTENAIRQYMTQNENLSDGFYSAPPDSSQPRIVEIKVCTSQADAVHRHGDPLQVDFRVHTPIPVVDAALSFQVVDKYNRPVLHSWVFSESAPFCRRPGEYVLSCRIPKCRLYMGDYRLSAYLTEGPKGDRFQFLEAVCPFQVVMHGTPRLFPWQPDTCTYLEDWNWQVEAASRDV